jgi:hypothetical protein
MKITTTMRAKIKAMMTEKNALLPSRKSFSARFREKNLCEEYS